MKKITQQESIVYQSKTGAIELKRDFHSNTVWTSQEEIANIFNVQRPAITKYIHNILKDNELNENSVCSKMERTAADGKTYHVQLYNLDIILAVGYRTNSS